MKPNRDFFIILWFFVITVFGILLLQDLVTASKVTPLLAGTQQGDAASLRAPAPCPVATGPRSPCPGRTWSMPAHPEWAERCRNETALIWIKAFATTGEQRTDSR